jgi:hypothetical protein
MPAVVYYSPLYDLVYRHSFDWVCEAGGGVDDRLVWCWEALVR